MTIEEKIKAYILTKYKSLRDFVNNSDIDIPYSTVDGMLKRGIYNASIANVLKICHALDISADELAKGKIVPANMNIQKRTHMTEINDIISFTKRNIQEYDDLTIDGKPMTREEIEMLLDGLDLSIGIIKRHRERKETKE